MGIIFLSTHDSSAFSCKEDICRGVGSLLVYVKSLKGLAAIRDAVWDLLSSDSISQHWSTVCHRLLEHRLAVWDDFLQQLFLKRLQVGALQASLLIIKLTLHLNPFALYVFMPPHYSCVQPHHVHNIIMQ